MVCSHPHHLWPSFTGFRFVYRGLGRALTWHALFVGNGRLTRFLLNPFAVPTNIIAGGSGYTFAQFLSYDIAGELTWIVLYGGLGYLAGTQWESLSQSISDYSSLLTLLVALGIGLYFFTRSRRHAQKAVVVLAP